MPMEIISKTEQLLGTAVEVKLPKQHSHLFPICFSEMKRIESAYSRFLPSSDLSSLNSNLGKWQEASGEFLHLLVRAEEFRQKTEGNFDIALKSALDALGYDEDYSFKPKKSAQSIQAALRWLLPAIQIDAKRRRVLLNREIDFGGFGKGYALDCVKALLESNGAFHYYINAGGDIFARKGTDSDCAPWEILLEHPDDPTRAVGKITLDNQSIAGSAPNRRKWGESHHLLNARTKKPVQGVKAIFVLSGTGIEADAYATALFTAGFEEGIALSAYLPVEMLFISGKGKMYQSKGFKAEIFG